MRLDVIEQLLDSLGAREVLSVPSGGEGQRMESLEPRPDDQVERARGLLPEGFRVEARFAPPRPEVTPVRPAFPGSLRSEEHTSELQSLMRISYAVFCLKKKNT